MRWLITRGKYEAAESVITRIAQLNRKGKPDISKVIKQAAEYIRVPNSRHHSVLTLFKTWKRARLSIALMFIWYVHRFISKTAKFEAQISEWHALG